MTEAAVMTSDQSVKRLPAELYDVTPGYDEEVSVRLAPGLSPDDVRRATILYNVFDGLWGVAVVVGMPGTGKDLFGNYITFRIKRYFPWKRILRDEKPRLLYGSYDGLFNENVLHDELEKMREVAIGTSATRIDAVMDRAADRWVTGKGIVLLENSVLYITEYWRICYNRDPHKPLNKTMGAIHREKRHLNCLIIGTAPDPRELDKKTCLQYVDWRVTCTRSKINKTRFTYFIEKVTYDRRMEELLPISKPFSISIDAGKPRSYIGDGRIVIRKYDYEPETEEERIVLDVLRAGVDTYEDLVEIIETEGDMTEWEILVTLKELKFKRSKRVVDYPCDFSIYNSKSAPQIKSAIKVNE